MTSLLDLDHWLLLKINLDWANPLFDIFFPWITEFHHSSIFVQFFLPAFLVCALWTMRMRGVQLVVMLLFTSAFTDFMCGKIIKPLVGRIRPCFDGVSVVTRAPIFGQLSFPSNHAANTFCIATILSAYFPRGKYVFYFFAFLVSYSRSYVGAHYPLDWIAGGLLGILIALGALRLRDQLMKRFSQDQTL